MLMIPTTSNVGNAVLDNPLHAVPIGTQRYHTLTTIFRASD